jgi:hypothetical protein
MADEVVSAVTDPLFEEFTTRFDVGLHFPRTESKIGLLQKVAVPASSLTGVYSLETYCACTFCE